MSGDAFDVVRQFEREIAIYTGARFAVAVNSCTMALRLAIEWWKLSTGHACVCMPSHTYPSVPMQAYHAGLKIEWWHESWRGVYRMAPSYIWDCAKRFTSGMYVPGSVQCVSFHARKLLPIGQGGAILHDDELADSWYRRARFDGRAEGVPTKDDVYTFAGWHCYMLPEQAARGLHLMTWYPMHVQDQPMDDYPDMSKAPLFEGEGGEA